MVEPSVKTARGMGPLFNGRFPFCRAFRLPGILGGGCQFAYLKNVPITWTYAIEKESLRFEALEHVHIVKVEQLSQDMC
jgi:hypothetical protein